MLKLHEARTERTGELLGITVLIGQRLQQAGEGGGCIRFESTASAALTPRKPCLRIHRRSVLCDEARVKTKSKTFKA